MVMGYYHGDGYRDVALRGKQLVAMATAAVYHPVVQLARQMATCELTSAWERIPLACPLSSYIINRRQQEHCSLYSHKPQMSSGKLTNQIAGLHLEC